VFLALYVAEQLVAPSLSRPVAFGLVGDGPSDRAVSSSNTPPLVWVREATALTGQAQSRASGGPAEQTTPARPARGIISARVCLTN